MQLEGIPFKETGYFSEIICDYLDEAPQLKPFYNRFSSLKSFKAQIAEKQDSFSDETRKVLASALLKQYQEIATSAKTKKHLSMLREPNTFTVVTGHQLNLFTGPLYFLYKIISTINLTSELSKAYPEQHFVPVYWMATEDHDFDEINYFNFKGKKIHWNKNASGAVGKLSTEGLEAVFELFSQELGPGTRAAKLKALFSNAYLKHNTLTAATRYLANELFGTEGLVIIDGDDKALKQCLIPHIKQDVFQNTAFKKVSETIS
ncbi:MAG: bacillithiol biosynthesis BshC, partial [Eudoraea sp.]|nr:bacillithiol biosynthesis BshC [Eudoraea sp.]